MAKLCKSKRTVESKVNPKVWYYGIEHCRMVTFASIPTGESVLPLNLINEEYAEELGYIHFTNGGTDPAPVGLNKIATIDVSAMADVSEVYTEMKIELDAATEANLYQSSIDVDGIDIINNFVGLITEEATGNDTGAIVTIGQQSFGGAIGILSEEGASASFEFETLDQTGDSTGNAIIESFLINVTATISMSIVDSSKTKFEELFIKPLGGSYENAGDKLIGFGTGNFFKSLIAKAGKLIGHDAGVAATDRSNDWVMLASIKPNSINFNKELQVVETEFVSYYDPTMPDDINIFRIGNVSAIDLANI